MNVLSVGVGIFADFMLTMVEVFDGYLQAPT